jgi:hypothetical protein
VAVICRETGEQLPAAAPAATTGEEELRGLSSIDGEQTSRRSGSISRKIASVFLLDSISEGSTDTGDRGEGGGV